MKKTLIALCVTFVASSQLTMAEVGRSAVAIGNYVTAEGDGSTAMGMHSHAYANLSTAVGAHATTKGNSSSALGLHANAIGGQSTALGQSSVARGDQSTAIGSGATTESRFSTAVGTNAKANHYSGVAIGFNSTTSDFNGVVSSTIDGVTYGKYAGHRPTSAVSIGSKGFERQLQNVAAGNVSQTSTDAVNGSQLYAVASQVSTNSERITNVYNTVQSYSSWMETQESQIYDLKLRDRDLREKITELNKLIDGNFEAIRNDINKNRRDSNAGIAGAIAIGTMMQPYEAGQSAITVGAGSFKNEAAIAIGASHITENGKWGFKGGVSADTRKNIGVGLSAAYFFGAKPKAMVAPQQVIVKETVVVREPAVVTEKKIRQ